MRKHRRVRTVGGTLEREALAHADGRVQEERAEDSVVDRCEGNVLELEQQAAGDDVRDTRQHGDVERREGLVRGALREASGRGEVECGDGRLQQQLRVSLRPHGPRIWNVRRPG